MLNLPGKYDHISDGELLENFYRDHDNQWLGVLFQRYTLLLFGVGMKYFKQEEEARDMVQQVFLKAITELGRYRVEYFKSWIYQVAKNHCLMKLRSSREKHTAELTEASQIVLPEEEREIRLKSIEKEHKLEILSLCLQELNEAQKTCVTLFYIEKRSYQDIVEMTGFTLLQVKSYIQNGKRNLRILLDQKLNQD